MSSPCIVSMVGEALVGDVELVLKREGENEEGSVKDRQSHVAGGFYGSKMWFLLCDETFTYDKVNLRDASIWLKKRS